VRLCGGGGRSEGLSESRGSFAVASCVSFDDLRTAMLRSILSGYGDGKCKMSDAGKTYWEISDPYGRCAQSEL
jgi:hypothetical protein